VSGADLWPYILAFKDLLPSEYITAIGLRGGSVVVEKVEYPLRSTSKNITAFGLKFNGSSGLSVGKDGV
jgi:hypothetical protein